MERGDGNEGEDRESRDQDSVYYFVDETYNRRLDKCVYFSVRENLCGCIEFWLEFGMGFIVNCL